MDALPTKWHGCPCAADCPHLHARRSRNTGPASIDAVTAWRAMRSTSPPANRHWSATRTACRWSSATRSPNARWSPTAVGGESRRDFRPNAWTFWFSRAPARKTSGSWRDLPSGKGVSRFPRISRQASRNPAGAPQPGAHLRWTWRPWWPPSSHKRDCHRNPGCHRKSTPSPIRLGTVTGERAPPKGTRPSAGSPPPQTHLEQTGTCCYLDPAPRRWRGPLSLLEFFPC